MLLCSLVLSRWLRKVGSQLDKIVAKRLPEVGKILWDLRSWELTYPDLLHSSYSGSWILILCPMKRSSS